MISSSCISLKFVIKTEKKFVTNIYVKFVSYADKGINLKMIYWSNTGILRDKTIEEKCRALIIINKIVPYVD